MVQSGHMYLERVTPPILFPQFLYPERVLHSCWLHKDHSQMLLHFLMVGALCFPRVIDFRNFIDVGVGVVNSDYRGEINVVLFNHSVEDFAVQAGDWIAQLILERIELPRSKRW